MVKKEQSDGHGVLYINEIAQLLSIAIFGGVGSKELDLAGFHDLMIGLQNDGAHITLVILSGAIDVEEFEPGNFAIQAFPERPEVKEVLGIAVHVEWMNRRCVRIVIGVAHLSIAIGGGA